VDPDALLARYRTLTEWSDALTGAGARVTVVQRFARRVVLTRDGVTYLFAPLPHLALARIRQSIDLAHVNGLIFPTETWWLRQILPARSAIVVQDHGGEPGDARGGRLARLRHSLGRILRGAADAFLFAAV